MSRDYEKEARELELAFLNDPVMSKYVPYSSLIQLTNNYGSIFSSCNYLTLSAAQSPVLKLDSPLEILLESFSKGDLEIGTPPETTPVEKSIDKPLSSDQKIAWEKLQKWVHTDEPYFVLRGYAGTGKTYLMQMLSTIKSLNIFYSAPTNKATKVLAKAVGKTSSKTTYSMLGLRMEQVENELVLKASGSPPYFPRNSILIIDEASMVGQELLEAINSARVRCKIKILFVGDPAQLPPVNEGYSGAWSVTKDKNCRAMLREVMRFDNQLLSLATALRLCIKKKDWESPLISDHSDSEGIWKWKTQDQFDRRLLKQIKTPEDMVETKVIAWRNKTVDSYNNVIRSHLGFKDIFCTDDILLLAAPVEQDGILIAHTDDEFKLKSVNTNSVRIDKTDIETYQLNLSGDQELILDIPKRIMEVNLILEEKSRIAKSLKGHARKDAWADFWSTKSKFNSVRYGYALTAHRSQGSTYKEVFLDQYDILSNSTKKEAFRCLYVGSTRPSSILHSY